jgi:hypothetical protein
MEHSDGQGIIFFRAIYPNEKNVPFLIHLNMAHKSLNFINGEWEPVRTALQSRPIE